MNKEFFYRIISSVILLPSVFFILNKGGILFNLFLIICFFISVFEWNKLAKIFTIKISGIFFLFISFFSIFLMRNKIEYNFNIDYLFLVLIICISTDVGGFVFGKLFKGPKLTKISPNKTYSGAIGSFILPLLILSFLIIFFKKEKNIILLFDTNLNFFIFVFFISFISQVGDLTVSFFKRLSKKKDTGRIIPGHGGLLDRVDGMLFAFPFAYITYNYFIT